MSRRRTWSGGPRRWAAALLLTVVMCMSLAVPSASAASSTLQPYLDKIVSWGVMRGDINGNLNADRTITRAEFVTLINRAFGYSKTGTTPFRDVPSTAWYAEDVGIAYTEGYIMGTTATTFSPNSSVTREQAAVILALTVNLLQLATFSLLVKVDFQVELNLLPLALAGAMFLLSRWMRQGLALREDNDSII